METILKSSILVAVTMSLVGCGGAAQTISSPAPVATTLSVFGDGSGVARMTSTSSGESGTFSVMAANIQTGVNNVNNNGDSISAVDLSNVTYHSSNAYGKYFTGSATINGIAVNVESYESFSGEVGIAYIVSANANLVMVGGTTATNIPTGSYTYNGTNIIGNRDGSYAEQGTFAMSVDFSNSTAAISGSTASSTFGGTGISINTSTGNFADTGIAMTVNGGASVPASISGQFNGNGATGVTGIYHDNSNNPLTVGMFAGER